MRLKYIVLLLIIVFICTSMIVPCTIFKTTYEGQTLVGNNEDWMDKDKKVWFLKPEEGKYGRVYFGFKNGWAQGGMNDQGLFFDWIAGFKEEWQANPERKNFYENLSEKILEEAANVPEALQFFLKYNIAFFSMSRIMLVDKSGNAVVVRFADRKLHIERIKCASYAVGLHKNKANRLLSRDKNVSLKTVSNILEKCLNHGEYATKYSNVYDLFKGEIYLYDFKRIKKSFKFNLNEELAKGNHYYDILKLEKQVIEPLRLDSKTSSPVRINPENINKMTGIFSGSNKRLKNLKISIEGNKIFFWPVPGAEKKFSLFPSSEKSLYMRFIDCHLNFRDKRKDGKYHEVLMKRANKEYKLKRVQ